MKRSFRELPKNQLEAPLHRVADKLDQYSLHQGNQSHFCAIVCNNIGEIDAEVSKTPRMASVAASLCSGVTCTEAASIGMITASIIIQQIGTTGIATRDQVFNRFQEHFSG